MTATMIPTWTLADRLRKAREASGLTQGELAERIGISRHSISNYEADRRTPNRPVLLSWSLCTGVDREWLLTGHAHPTDDPSEQVTPSTYRYIQLAA